MAGRGIRDRMVDGLLVLAVSGVAAISSQRWTGFNTPDSEFYASLALFGSDVSDRALDAGYATTRLGYIAPVRVLVTTLDPWVGFAVWRFLLVLLIVGSVYAVARLVSTRTLATIVASIAALNTVVLSFAGNTYLTGTILAATTTLLAVGCWSLLGSPRLTWLPAALAGALVGWLVMLNPYGMLLGLSMWLGLRVLQLRGDVADRWRHVMRDLLAAVAGFAVVVGALLLSGLAIFPGRSWFGTYLEWNSRLDYSTFIGDPDAWQRDIALLVPVGAVAIALIAVLTSRLRRPAAAALVVTMVNLAFTAAYLVVVPGPWLEAPTYVAKLWPGALIGLALAFAAMVGRRPLGWPGVTLAIAALPIVLWAGRWDRDLTVAQGLVILIAVLALTVIAALLLRREDVSIATGILVVLALAAMAIGAQLLQNGRGVVGSYGQFPFRAAYVDFDIETLMRSKVAAQEFVLAQTEPTDRVMTWTDADRLTAGIAGMQLWGWYNTVSTAPTLAPAEVDALRAARPNAVAMYAPTRQQILDFWASLPTDARPTVPQCTTVPFLGIGSPEAHVCVTRLDWT